MAWAMMNIRWAIPIGLLAELTPLNSRLSSLAPSLAQFSNASVVCVKANWMNIPEGLNTGKLQ